MARFNLSALALAALPLLSAVNAAVVTYNLNVTWMHGNPDGRQNRPVIGINGQWPIPTLYATKGDQMVVNVYNGLGNQSTSIHFHGMFQNGTTNMDGAVGVTQCPIPAGKSMTYRFNVRPFLLKTRLTA
jgi:iron transport multicopper oxidase